ncbi:MAG: recombinase family protein [Parasporobacterium sp.]|nr:recombinase family protein [Parasporobacterium sp.]
MKKKAAIYHFTDGSEKRPIICEKQLKALEDYAISKGFDVTGVFVDKSLRRCDRQEFNRLLDCCDQFNALVTKDFYHLSKNTMQSMALMREFRDKGVLLYTLENGCFVFEEEPFDEPLRVVTYNCRFGESNELKQIIVVQNDIMKLFAEKKTNWSVVDQFFDESQHQNDGEQINLQNLIQNKELYDLLLVHNLNDVHWRTANFCKIREALQMDIYSLQDGYLKYRKEI